MKLFPTLLILSLVIPFNATAIVQAQAPSDRPTPNQTSDPQRQGFRVIDLQAIGKRVPLTGTDPLLVALKAFGASYGDKPPYDETGNVTYLSRNRAIVAITQMGFQDDSVRGMRYRIDLIASTVNGEEQWRMVWAGQQQLCQPGRGSQDWTMELCL